MKQKTKLSKVTWCLLIVALILFSCEQRDPQAEYELLCETVYSSPNEGESAAQEYIDYFYKNKKAKTTEVSEIRHQYRQIESFLANTFNSYMEFLNQSRDLNKELSHSNYTGVRKLWKTLYEKERNRLLGPLMDSITESDFDEFFKTQVSSLCEKEFNIWDIESIDRVSISTPTLIKDGTAKKSNGEYRVHLRGNVFGVLTKTARISIEGTIGPDESGNIITERIGYQFIEKPIL